MAKVIVKKRIIRIEALPFIFLGLAIVFKLYSCLYLNTIINKLEIQIQDTNNKIATLQVENREVTAEIQDLENRDRISLAAVDAGLNQNHDNIISIDISKGE